MKTAVLIILSIAIIIGVIVMLNRLDDGIKYETYSSRNKNLNIVIDYISGWESRERGGEQGLVIFIEPKQDQADFSANISVMAQAQTEPLSIGAEAEKVLNKRLKLKDARVIAQTKRKLLAQQAVDLELAHKGLNQLYSTEAKLIPMKERIIVLQKYGKLFTIRYMNREEEFSKYDKAFYHCLKTLRPKTP
ncbi:hypothetical protein ACFL2I_04300 [Candidatus Omnitrophota bacterium]